MNRKTVRAFKKSWIVVNVITAVNAYNLTIQQLAFLIGSRTDIVPIFEGTGFPTLSRFMLAYYVMGFIVSCVWAFSTLDNLYGVNTQPDPSALRGGSETHESGLIVRNEQNLNP